jgi:hypothetical protein
MYIVQDACARNVHDECAREHAQGGSDLFACDGTWICHVAGHNINDLIVDIPFKGVYQINIKTEEKSENR